ncbi:MAG: DUF2330 domain-containing protein, partial [Patescibacteria group bacterium]|nr:DUF2330 domain-containing protein [Patescibacteria group bacterium]
MGKTIYKTTILMLAVIFICQPLQLKADGGMIPYQWDYKDIYEPSQTSLIVYKNGEEDLYLKVNYEGETNEFVWVIPTPSYPKASKAPKDIFTELSIVTGEEMRNYFNDAEGNKDLVAGESNVVVHSQKNIGIYEITVLSASGTDGLFDWLNNNDYKVNQEAKELLDWYVQKEWYFTAVRIDLESKIKQAVEEFKKIDSDVNQENFSEKFADYYTNSFKNNNFEQFQKSLPILMILVPSESNDIERKNSIEGFNEIKEALDIRTDEDWIDAKNEVEGKINEIFSELNSDKIGKYSDYIEPIKISFSSNSIVYPLKISQMSTRVPEDPSESSKTNEILLYILTDNQMKAPGFSNEYAESINAEKLIKMEEEVYDGNLEGLKEIIGDKEYFLTKIRRDFAKVEMDEDLYLINGQNSEEAVKFEVDLFIGENCPHCDKAKSFLDKLEYSHSYLKINSYEVYNNEDNNKLYQQAVAKHQISSAGVPLIIIGDEYVLGFASEEIAGKEIKNKIDSYLLKPLAKSYEDDQKYIQAKNKIHGSAMADRLKGKIILKVEDNGEAYYINSNTKTVSYLGRPADAFSVMRDQGIGITNANLEKIQIGSNNLTGADSDGDGLPDMFEDAIGT